MCPTIILDIIKLFTDNIIGVKHTMRNILKIIRKKKILDNYDSTAISANKKNIEELIWYIEEKFKAEKISIDGLDSPSKKIFTTAKKNLYSHLQSIQKDITEINYDYLFYQIKRTDVSDEYFRKWENDVKYIYLVIEKNTEYIFTQSSELRYELLLYRGVSDYDINNNTIEFQSYLSLLTMKDDIKKLAKKKSKF